MQAEIQDGWNWRYKKAVTAACSELEEMQAPTPTWPDHAAAIITKHLTPLFRELRDEAKCAALRPNESSSPTAAGGNGGAERKA